MENTQLLANNIRTLSADIVQKAKSGHPGMPIGSADFVSVLWSDFLQFNPDRSDWINRDRFILSAGHGSALLYSLLHLFGYKVTMDDLKNFRQWGSHTAGHPEYKYLPGIECTTGPLGQGFAMGVGMALAAKMTAARLNTDTFSLIDHHIYAVAGDGCLMEGVAAEAASLAGHLKLDNIIYFYDSNNITIEGSTDLAFSDDTAKRFEAYGWKTWTVDGHNLGEISAAVKQALSYKGAPKLIICRTHIACHCPTMQDTAKSHGTPLGDEEIRGLKKSLGFPEDETFYVSPQVRDYCKRVIAEKKERYDAWQKKFQDWQRVHPEKAKALEISLNKVLPADLEDDLSKNFSTDKAEATRVSSGNVIQKIAAKLPFISGGSADLEPSVKCLVKNEPSVKADDFSGRNLHFGIREHAMGAVLNGMSLYGMFIPYGSTFLVFSDYMRGAIRLSALMGLQVVYVFTHDSIFLGEDGPTHQPVEHLGALRVIPNLLVIRPADAAETAQAWLMALKNADGPTALILSRQNLPQLAVKPSVDRGAYILRECRDPQVILLASGSEVDLICKAAEILAQSNVGCRVISVPSIEVFMRQNKEYREGLIPDGFKNVVAVEASLCRDWDRFTSNGGLVIGMKGFGHSAPSDVLAEKYGFTPEAVAQRVKKHLEC